MDTPTIEQVKDRTWIPNTLTVVWFLLGGIVLYSKRDALPNLELNQIGDALAGFFSPVAFLWLVFGYRQQGKELRLSSDALRLQAAELKNSVEQQKELVSVTWAEHSLNIQRDEQASEREKAKMRPIFVLKQQGSGPGIHKSKAMYCNLKNNGATVTKLSIKANNYYISVPWFSVFLADADCRVDFESDPQDQSDFKVEIEYTTIAGIVEKQTALGIDNGAFHTFLPFQLDKQTATSSSPPLPF